MIKVIKNRVIFTGREEKQIRQYAKELKLSAQETFTGLLWEMIMREARKGRFKKKVK